MARQYYKDSTTGNMAPLGVKVEDTLPVGTIVEYNGQNIPEGWVDIGNDKIEKQYQVIPTNAKLENGDSTSSTNGYTCEYINDHSIVVSATEPAEGKRKKVWLQHSRNLLNYNNILVEGFYVENDIIRTTNTSSDSRAWTYSNSNWQIKLLPGTYKLSLYFTNKTTESSGEIRILNSSSATLDSSSLQNLDNYTTTINTENELDIGIMIKQYDGEYKIQLEKNYVTDWQPYVRDREYILNNNIYGEFTPQNKIYSTEEMKIGTWIDGKPLYRKVVKYGFNSTNQLTIPLGVNYANIVYSHCELVSADNKTCNVPYYASSSSNCLGNVSNSNFIYIGTGTIFRAGILLITIEYTK